MKVIEYQKINFNQTQNLINIEIGKKKLYIESMNIGYDMLRKGKKINSKESKIECLVRRM